MDETVSIFSSLHVYLHNLLLFLVYYCSNFPEFHSRVWFRQEGETTFEGDGRRPLVKFIVKN